MSKPIVGIVGLGIMGGAMAESLLQNGYRVVGYDIDQAAMQRLESAGGLVVDSVQQLAGAVRVVIVSLSTSASLKATIDQMADAAWPAGRRRQAGGDRNQYVATGR